MRQMPVRAADGRIGEVLSHIAAAPQRAHQVVNTEPVGLYRELGGYLIRKIASAEWGDGVVDELPATIAREDLAIILVFIDRGLTCLVSFELKVLEFRPKDLVKLRFYLEALDRDVKKPHECLSIVVLHCATKDNEANIQPKTDPFLALQSRTHLLYASRTHLRLHTVRSVSRPARFRFHQCRKLQERLPRLAARWNRGST